MLDSIIQHVEANEALYSNLELIVRRDIRRGSDIDGVTQSEQDFEYEIVRVVHQSGMYYLRRERRQATVDEDHLTNEDACGISEDLVAFDGEVVRAVPIYFDSAAVIRRGWYEEARLLRPHTMIFFSHGVYFPLSTYLKGDAAVRVCMIRGAPSYYGKMRFEWSVLGEEVVDDQQCIKLRAAQRDPGEPREGFMFDTLWLAPERNYLPVRREVFRRDCHATSPISIHRADDFRCVAPGTWMAFHLKKSMYDWEALKKNREVVHETDEYAVLKADPRPKYEIDLFRQIPIRAGMKVEECGNPGPVRRYSQGQS
jgi:hypothetical protein